MAFMADTAAGVRFTVLGPTDTVDDERVSEFYAYPDARPDRPAPGRCWVRGNMITSIDGAATASGKTARLGGPGDRTLFALMRYAADVILVGAATVRVENYSGAQMPVAQRNVRQRRGQAEVPPLAIVTRTGDLDPDARCFTRTEVPPLVFTCTDAYETTRSRLGAAAEVIDASGSATDSVDVSAVLAVLARRGLWRVLAEGGPVLLSQLITADLLDELCLTVAPYLVGGSGPRIVSGTGEVLTRMRPAHLLSDADGYLYTRYVRGT
ncbi:ribD C-terminal domain protein [Mycolicibacterium hassiacum DSM 44199]|jgi:riboflavin biosynthesis pyrimidine reductase|uniref:RibD C-terminal domain protein n=2 Tax=Mycolicibacterium hassiacum TaxID=46351 RepID=K5BK33_MYCHD|nr:ribD C-terminal domain protein [Mycolicibacterium hassiacum DSM 44199]MDA4085086.1 hypothetical protein [Mycolicibacterium hassiacum DSM 44199]VCT90597.1 Riboflavin biosynthesis protein RibD [Mycolicibacterium hassiacum DSM 44199]